jgi:hypothetical protein
MTATITLISATPGDLVPGVELAHPDCPEIPGLLDRPEVTAFLANNGYGLNDPDELVYLVADDNAEIPAGYPTLTVQV